MVNRHTFTLFATDARRVSKVTQWLHGYTFSKRHEILFWVFYGRVLGVIGYTQKCHHNYTVLICSKSGNTIANHHLDPFCCNEGGGIFIPKMECMVVFDPCISLVSSD